MASQVLDMDQGTVLVSSLSVEFVYHPPFFEGQRYAYQTLKIAIIHTVRNFRLVKCSETTKEDALNFSLNENGFVGGIKFKVERLQEE